MKILFCIILIFLLNKNVFGGISKVEEVNFFFILERKDSVPQTTATQKGNAKLEQKIINDVFSLPEVRKKNKYIDSLTKHKKGITIIIAKKPDKIHNYYWVQAGYNSELRFEPYYNFYVYQPNRVIKYYDPMSDKILTLKEWRGKLK
jgi:hypothetical protein